MPWMMFSVPCPTRDGQTARDLYELRLPRTNDEVRASARKHGCRFHRCWYTEDESTLYTLTFWDSNEGAVAFTRQWGIVDDEGEETHILVGDFGLVPLDLPSD